MLNMSAHSITFECDCLIRLMLSLVCDGGKMSIWFLIPLFYQIEKIKKKVGLMRAQSLVLQLHNIVRRWKDP